MAESRAVLLTGAGGGLGQAATQALADRGVKVYAALRGSAANLPQHPGVQAVQLDVTDPDSIAGALARILDDGCTGLHGIVNNAGIIVQGPLELVTAEDLRHQFEVNVFGALAVTQAFLPLLRAGRGRLVNVTAATARVAGPFFGPVNTALAKSKAASPTIAADAVVKALTARKPKARYTVGADTRLLGLLARLPLRTRDRLVAGVTGLNKIPAAR